MTSAQQISMRSYRNLCMEVGVNNALSFANCQTSVIAPVAVNSSQALPVASSIPQQFFTLSMYLADLIF
jgi:hypothetical protein